MATELLDSGLGKVIGCLAGRLQLLDQGQDLLAHGLLDRWELAWLVGLEAGPQPLGPGVEATPATGGAEQAAKLRGVRLAAWVGSA